jgi:hypothetical protein
MTPDEIERLLKFRREHGQRSAREEQQGERNLTDKARKQRPRGDTELDRDLAELTALSDDELWTEVTTASGLCQHRAAGIWEKRQKSAERRRNKAAVQQHEGEREAEREAARQAVDHWGTDQLLAFIPGDETTRTEIDGVRDELWRRKTLIEAKHNELGRAPGRNRPYWLKDITPRN